MRGRVQEPDTGNVNTYQVEVDPVSGAIYLQDRTA